MKNRKPDEAIFELVATYQNTQGVNPTRSIGIPAKCIVKKDGEDVMLAYQAGMPSIYFDKWPKNKSFDEITPPKIRFTNFVYPMGKNDKNLIEYFRMCSWNEDNTNSNAGRSVSPIFKEVSVADSIKETPIQVRERLKAESTVMGMTSEELLSIAKIIQGEEMEGGVTISFLDVNGKFHEEDVLREAMRIFAADNAEKFLTFVGDKNTEVLQVLHSAIDMNIIKVNRAARTISYCESGDQIPKTKSPIGINPLDYFADRVMEDSDVSDHYENICRLVDGGGSGSRAQNPSELINEAKELGLIVYEGRRFYINGSKTEISNNNELASAIKDNITVMVADVEVNLRDYLETQIRLVNS